MNLLGITEIVGKKGTCKSRYVTNLVGLKKTLYFTTKSLHSIPSNSFITTIYDIETLLKSMQLIEEFVQLNGIECIIIDSLDSLCTTMLFKHFYKNIFMLIQSFRLLSFTYDIPVLIVNEFDNGHNYVLKKWFSYLPNRKFVITKNGKIFKIKKIYMYKDDIEYEEFTIIDNKIIFF